MAVGKKGWMDGLLVVGRCFILQNKQNKQTKNLPPPPPRQRKTTAPLGI